MTARPLTVHLLRHGEVFNPDHVLYGRLPGFGLSTRGRAMADRISSVVDAVPSGRARVGVLVASPLQRAQETAAPVAAALGLTVDTDERLVEAGSMLQGRRVDASVLRDPAFLRALTHPLRPGWGEPYDEIARRMWGAVVDAAARADAAGCAALLVSHQLPVWTARRWGQRRRLWHDPRSRQCRLASLTTLTFDADGLFDGSGTGDGPLGLPGASSRAHTSPEKLRDALVGVDYTEPARDLVAGAVDVTGPGRTMGRQPTAPGRSS